jgi:hypothetical protein
MMEAAFLREPFKQVNAKIGLKLSKINKNFSAIVRPEPDSPLR